MLQIRIILLLHSISILCIVICLFFMDRRLSRQYDYLFLKYANLKLDNRLLKQKLNIQENNESEVE